MSRPHVALALAAAVSSLLLFIQLQHHFGGGILDGGGWKHLNWTLFMPESQQILPWIHTTPLPQDEPHLASQDEYLIGVGKADITGPVVEINLMGYADPKQTGTGLRQRLYSRAFIVGSTNDPSDRFIYVVLDTQSGDTAVRHGILEGLWARGPDYSMYSQNNVAITGTHSHSGPGAWLNYLLPQITSKGFDRQSYEAIVNGTLLSIERAHESLTAGRLRFGKTRILDANINRSLFAYLANPHDERKQYEDDVDKDMSFIILQRKSDDKDIGILNWFPVHGTSMLGNNTLVTGDNKGVAASLFEKRMADFPDAADGFVAGFSQSNVGDTSPNVLGAYCEDGSGEQCTLETSLCNGRKETCHGRGPYFGMDDGGTKSCFEIGQRQFDGAWKGYISSSVSPISGPVRAAHVFRDFSNYTFVHPNGSSVRTCSAAMGYSFAAGTTDGPGAFDFKQNNSGEADANPLWKVVRNALHTPTEEQVACQYPKPILLDVGATTSPYQWSPNIVDIQILRVGQLFIIVSPGEATTMSGRRWKAAISSAASKLSLTKGSPEVVLGGPANSYTHYIATEEEYAIQRYEGASTLYGPHTLNAYIEESKKLLRHLDQKPSSQHLDPGPYPPIFTNKSLSFITPVVLDGAGLFHSFGDTYEDVKGPDEHVYSGGETVRATFVGANPRNNLRLEGTFASVNRLEDDLPVRTDAEWDLVYEWRRLSSIVGTSEVTISWELPDDVEAGHYYIVYNGDSKSLGSQPKPFRGQSSIFRVG